MHVHYWIGRISASILNRCVRAESEMLFELQQSANELFSLVRQAEHACQLLHDSVESEFSKRYTAQNEENAEASLKVRQQFDEAIRREFAALRSPEIFSQLDWTNPALRNYSSLANGGMDSSALRFGSFTITENGTGDIFPLILEVLNRTCVVISSDSVERSKAVSVCNSIILRHLVAISPGKLIIRFFDAKEHGRAFSGFIQALPQEISGGKAGTTMREMDAILDELDRRIATVSQKYLNAVTPSLHAFNKVTVGDVEPFYLLALDNFLEGFDESRAIRVLRIAEYGPAAGVFTVFSTSRIESIYNLTGGDNLLSKCTHIELSQADAQIHDLGQTFLYPAHVDLFPDVAISDRLLAHIGASRRTARSENEPFAVEPTDAWWRGDTLTEIEVAVGRTRNGDPVNLYMNEEGYTGALIAGSSGKGKSNLLHVIIARLMTKYGPDCLNLYLLDLKGIEFNIYEQYRCPHVKMILSDMSQKLGLSVLREFQGVLFQRKKMFSAQRRQKLSDYNQVQGIERLPRIVIVIDEFQKLFAGDVSMARENEEIVINLLRQGRGYGIHLIMASQNLSSQTTPRDFKTLFQIRIVLQFRSPSDYSLVLESDYNAGEVLKERGQAVYDTGEKEPSFFLIPHLPFDKLEGTLELLSKFTIHQKIPLQEIVFLSGEAASDIKRNLALAALVNSGTLAVDDIELWIGDAFSLRGCASLILRRQTASNIFVMCQERHFQESLTMVAMALLSVLAHSPNNKCYIIVAKSRKRDELRFLDALAKAFPERVMLKDENDVGLLNEMAARIKAGEEPGDANALLIFAGLQRLGTLRAELQNLYSRPAPLRGVAPTVNICDSLRSILEDGPRFGIHTLVITDSLSSMDRQVPSRFNLRIGFRLTDSDSNLLFGTNQAEGLEDGFAIFVDKGEAAESQEFRPYVEIDPVWFEKQVVAIRTRNTSRP